MPGIFEAYISLEFYAALKYRTTACLRQRLTLVLRRLQPLLVTDMGVSNLEGIHNATDTGQVGMWQEHNPNSVHTRWLRLNIKRFIVKNNHENVNIATTNPKYLCLNLLPLIQALILRREH